MSENSLNQKILTTEEKFAYFTSIAHSENSLTFGQNLLIFSQNYWYLVKMY